MVERRVTVGAEVGLHARPAAVFAQAAAKAPMPVTVARPDGESVDARSILAVLSLDVRGYEDVVLRAEGEGADGALDALAEVVAAPGPVS